MPEKRELLVMIEVWLALAQWTRTSVGHNPDDPQELAELGKAAGLEAAARDLMDLLQKQSNVPRNSPT